MRPGLAGNELAIELLGSLLFGYPDLTPITDQVWLHRFDNAIVEIDRSKTGSESGISGLAGLFSKSATKSKKNVRCQSAEPFLISSSVAGPRLDQVLHTE